MNDHEFTPLRCIGCGATDFDPTPGRERVPEPVMTLARFWLRATAGAGIAYAVCNACWDAKLGVLWNDDGTVARVWHGEDPVASSD